MQGQVGVEVYSHYLSRVKCCASRAQQVRPVTHVHASLGPSETPNRIESHTRGLNVPSVSKARQILRSASNCTNSL